MPCDDNFLGILPSSKHRLVSKDNAHLAKMHPALVQDWATAEINDCRQRIRYLKSVYNAAAPLNRALPAEVLMEVFGHLEPHTRRDKGAAYLHVCRLWRALIMRTTEFWVDVLRRKHDLDYAGERHFFDMAVAAVGKRVPVSVTVYGFSFSALKSLAAHAPRLTALNVTIEIEDMGHLRTLLEGSVPLLESLTVCHPKIWAPTPTRSAMVQLPLTRTSLPRLRSLEHPLASLIVDDGYKVDLPLRRLALSGCLCNGCHAAARGDAPLARVLTYFASTLRVLELYNVLHQRPGRALEASADPLKPLGLPKLRTLYAENESREIRNLLDERHITYPATCEVEVRDGSDNRPSFRQCLPRSLAAYARVATADEIRFVYNDASDHYAVLDMYVAGSRRLRVTLKQRLFWRALRDLSDIVSSSGNASVQTLVIDVNTRYIPCQDDGAEVVAALLLAYPQLRRLSFGKGDARQTILPLLKGVPDDAAHPLCPKLEELCMTWECTVVPSGRVEAGVDCAEFCDVVAEMLHRRKGQGCSLKKLHIDVVQNWADKKRWDDSVIAGVKEDFRRHLGDLLEGLDVTCVVD